MEVLLRATKEEKILERHRRRENEKQSPKGQRKQEEILR